MSKLILSHNDLYSVPKGSNGRSIYWLRLWRGDEFSIATVTGVPGNPGFSVVNGIDSTVDLIADEFDVDLNNLELYLIWPPGSHGEESESSVHKVVCPDIEFEDVAVTLSDIEYAIGGQLPELPPHEDLYAQVISKGGGIWQPIEEPVFTALPVGELPVPHGPYSCRHSDRFKEIQARCSDNAMSREEKEQTVGKEFLSTLSRTDLSRCRYHKADWKRIADESVRIIEQIGKADPEQYLQEVKRSKLRKRDKGWLDSLFRDPIFVGGDSFTNGQHRGCALRFSGAQRAAIVTGYEDLGQEEIVWTYKGGG